MPYGWVKIFLSFMDILQVFGYFFIFLAGVQESYHFFFQRLDLSPNYFKFSQFSQQNFNINNIKVMLLKFFINKISDYSEICLSLYFQSQPFRFVVLHFILNIYLEGDKIYHLDLPWPSLSAQICLQLLSSLDLQQILPSITSLKHTLHTHTQTSKHE